MEPSGEMGATSMLALLAAVAAVSWRSGKQLRQDGKPARAWMLRLLWVMPLAFFLCLVLDVMAGAIGNVVVALAAVFLPTKAQLEEYEAMRAQEKSGQQQGKQAGTVGAQLNREIAALRKMGRQNTGGSGYSYSAPSLGADDDDRYIWSHPSGRGEFGEIQFRYRNLRGVTGVRRVRVQEFTHKGFAGYDLGKRAPRTFNYRGVVGAEVTLLDTGEIMTVYSWIDLLNSQSASK